MASAGTGVLSFAGRRVRRAGGYRISLGGVATDLLSMPRTSNARSAGRAREGTGWRARELAALFLLIALAAGVRFVAIGHQSYWFDESVTVSIVRHSSLSGVLSGVSGSESTPPLYYLLAWIWSKLAGTSPVALRSLSAVAGVAVVPVGWAVARRLVGVRAAFIAAALIAVNPMLVWYSQEARAYELLVLLGALSFLFFVRFRDEASLANAVGWATASSFALLTHYFAAFLIVVEFAWLLIELPAYRRRTIASAVPVVVVGLALVPLAYHQERAGRTAWIAGDPLGSRVNDVFHELGSANVGLISSNSPAPHGGLGVIAIVLVLAGLALAALATSKHERAGAAVAGAVGLCTLALALGPVVVGLDFFKDRNLIIIWVPLAIALSSGLATRRTLLAGAALAGGICGLGLAVDIQVTRDADLQRQNWRGLARAMGPARETRAVIVEPGYATTPLQIYGHQLIQAIPGLRVKQIVLVGQLPSNVPSRLGANGPPLVQSAAFNGELRLARYEPAHGFFTLSDRVLRSGSSPLLVESGPQLTQWTQAFFAQLARWQQLDRFLRARRSASPPSPLITPTVPPSRLLALPPELAGITKLRAHLRETYAAAAGLTACCNSAGASGIEFDRAFRRLIAVT